MKARVVTKIQIAAKPAEVFKYLGNLRYHRLWNPHLQSDLPDIPATLGLTYRSSSLLFGVKIRSKNTIAKFSPNKEVQVCNNTGTLEYCVNYRLHTNSEGTLLTCTTTVSSESRSFAFAKPVLKLLAQRELRADLQLLKVAIEQHLE